ncbi:MAG: Lpg1974 family pore-forming outer membrane protein [Candidatus Rhabdochlamydia sp.]
MLNRYLLSLFIATLSISCLSAYDQDFQEFKDFQGYKEYQKTKEKKVFLERERKNYQEQQRLNQEEKQCCQEEGRNSYEEYLEFLEYRRNLERENLYCKELEKSRLCEISQIDPNKDRVENFRFSADWLYFKAVQDALPFSVTVPDNIDLVNNSYFAGKVSEPKWKYNSGVRVACGIPTGLGNWEVGASWSYVRNTASNSKTSANNHLFTIISSSHLSSSGDLYADHASEKWKLNFNTVDLTLESPIYVNNSLKIRPIIGIQGSSIQQKNSADYNGFFGSGLNLNANPPSKVRGKNNTWGIGPKFGLGLTIAMAHQCNFNFLASFGSLFGKGKSNLTYSDFIGFTRDSMSNPIAEVPLNAPANKISYNTTRMFSVIQVQGALEKSWNLDCGTLSIVIGWEAQNWLRQQRLITYGNVGDPSVGADLTLQGPFARINMDF